jgi:HK97 family phage portal protein
MNWSGYTDLILGGNYFRIFDEKYKSVMHVPIERVEPILNDKGTNIKHILIWDDIGRQNAPIPYERVIQHKFPNPFTPFWGMSLYMAASRPILMDRLKNEFEMAFYLRGATNSGVIETTQDINKSRMERLMRTFEQVYTGKRNWWRTIFLPKGAKWVSSGLTMSEMQHLEGLKENRKTLLAVLGIPPSQIGLIEDVNRANSEEQEGIFWNNTIVPLAKFIASGWNNSYLVRTKFKDTIEVEPDLSNITALQGSLIKKGLEADSLLKTHFIDEIRAKIYGAEPLPDGKGQRFFNEIKSEQIIPILTMPAPETDIKTVTKSSIIDEQEKIEQKLIPSFVEKYEEYLDFLFEIITAAIKLNENLDQAIIVNQDALGTKYSELIFPVLIKALNKGFNLALINSKSLSLFENKLIKSKKVHFTRQDEQAINYLKEEQDDTQRAILAKRSLESFVGFNNTTSKRILDIIATGLSNGENIETIAGNIRMRYGEAYKNQSFIIARTETLTSVSQGLKWNNDILSDIFTKTEKKWIHVGDIATNPDARQNHYEFDRQGPQKREYKWGGILDYPRDYSAPPSETINCRCTMVTIIPDDAQSNADIILGGV